MKKLYSILFCLFIAGIAQARIFPGEGKLLTYRRIGFFVDTKDHVVKYKFEVAEGNIEAEDSFKKHIIVAAEDPGNRKILEVPSFGKQYTWRATRFFKDGRKEVDQLTHFTISWIPEIDTGHLRLKILKTAQTYKDAYVFVDGHKALYNMKGEPVWFLPHSERLASGRAEVRDMKLSPRGSITLLKNEKAVEISYDGDSLWQAPNNGEVNGDSTERYHHEFTRLANGHYMVLGDQKMVWDHMYGAGADTADDRKNTDGASPGRTRVSSAKIDFGTVIEYDEQGKVAWSWKSSDYFTHSDLVNYQSEHRSPIIDVHENSFSFDEQDSVVYISYKNISRILKVKYPTGEVMATYGEIFKPGVPPSGNGLFCDQHACNYLPGGYISLYNNNGCNDSAALPTALLLKETPGGGLEKTWEYQCTMDGININPMIKNLKERQQALEQSHMKARLGRGTLLRTTSGGNVTELPDHTFFVSMNAQYGKMFIVNRDKKILWSAIPEHHNIEKQAWFVSPHQYRASMITAKQLDELIWSSQQ